MAASKLHKGTIKPVNYSIIPQSYYSSLWQFSDTKRQEKNRKTLKKTHCSILVINIIFFCCISSFAHSASLENNARTSNKNTSKISSTNKALGIINTANIYYKNKRYYEAIEQYTGALTYLTGDNSKNQLKRARVYIKIAESYKRLKEREKTAHFYTKALDTYILLGNKEDQARTLNTLAEAERYLGNLVLALNYSNRSIEIHKTISDTEGYAKALMGAGIIYRNIGRYEKSLEHIHQAHIFFKELKDIKGIAKTSIQIGLIYSKLEQFDVARSFYLNVIELPREKIDTNTLASALRELAVIDLNSQQFDSAFIMAHKALSIYKEAKNKEKSSLTTRVIANIYRDQGDFVNAIKYYRESLALAIEIGSKIYRVKAQTPLAACLIGENTDEAVKLLYSSLAIAEKLAHKGQLLYAYRTLRQAEESRSNFAESLQFAKKEISLTKEIQQEKDDNKLTLAKANLYSHKLEMELDTLRKQLAFEQLESAKKNNEIEISQQAQQINELELTKNKYATLALALLLAICLTAVFFVHKLFMRSKERNRELGYLASRDPLTNCLNRRSLFEFMDRYFNSAEAYELYDECCVIMADIDHFKNINDTYGHSSGDNVIQVIASTFQTCVRKNDIVARFGGEEFCIILHRVSQGQAMAIAESMRDKVEKSYPENISVSASFGVSSLQFEAKSPSELIEQADLALYKSKSTGRNQVTLWDESL